MSTVSMARSCVVENAAMSSVSREAICAESSPAIAAVVRFFNCVLLSIWMSSVPRPSTWEVVRTAIAAVVRADI